MNSAGQERRICRIKRSRPVSRVLSRTIIPLGPPSPAGSSNLPGSRAGRAYGTLFGLAPSGVCRTGLLPDSWCALTAPFHPCHASRSALRRRRIVRRSSSLLHFPSARAAQALPGTLPCGARTFLPCIAAAAIARPTPGAELTEARRAIQEGKWRVTLLAGL